MVASNRKKLTRNKPEGEERWYIKTNYLSLAIFNK